MEKMSVVDLNLLIGITGKCLDLFAFLNEAASILSKVGHVTSIRNAAKVILRKLYTENIAKDDVSRSTICTKLRDLVTDVLLNVVSESLNEHEVMETKFGIDDPGDFTSRFEAKLEKTLNTFNRSLKTKLSRNAKTLMKLVKKHMESIKHLQNAQEEYWASMCKQNRCQMMLDTTKSTRDYQNPLLTWTQLELRDEEINSLQSALDIKKVKTIEAWHDFVKEANGEENARRTMIKVNTDFTSSVTLETSERIWSGLNGLKEIAENCIFNTVCHGNLLRKIGYVDVDEVTESVLKTCSCTYFHSGPTPYLDATDFQIRPANTHLEKAQIDVFETEQQDTVAISGCLKTSCSGFLVGQKGTLIVRKAATTDCNIEFGWTRKYPWAKKQWGFFKREHVTSYQPTRCKQNVNKS